MPFIASIGMLYQAECTVEPNKIKVLNKTIVPPSKPAHLLLFMFISTVTNYVTKYFRGSIILLTLG
jgi:hypothetical protein